jgi:cytochrome c peroxidase
MKILAFTHRMLRPMARSATLVVLVAPAFAAAPGNTGTYTVPPRNTGSYNLHLEETVRFHPVAERADPISGRELFGLAVDGIKEDARLALFQGESQALLGAKVVSNGRTCFTCHRGPDAQFGLPEPPLVDQIPLASTLFSGIGADAQGDPDAFFNLNELGLFKYRPNRFNSTRKPSDPFRQVFFWRKSPKLLNIGLATSFLNDGRGRVIFEAARGAVFSHTQAGDSPFDDLFPLQAGKDMEAFLFSLFTDPRLEALRDPADPLHQTLKDDPFYTVPVQTSAQRKGMQVFRRSCMACHNTPNVFSNMANVRSLGGGVRPPDHISWAPSVGRTYNVGIAERNKHGLRFTRFNGETQEFEPIVLALIDEDGTVVMHEVTFDIGLAATTGRTEDIGRFKVPQLRNLISNGPYFHDNSADTLEEVVDYHNSEQYNNSKDGRLYPIHMKRRQRDDLVEFLKIL